MTKNFRGNFFMDGYFFPDEFESHLKAEKVDYQTRRYGLIDKILFPNGKRYVGTFEDGGRYVMDINDITILADKMSVRVKASGISGDDLARLLRVVSNAYVMARHVDLGL